jgi:hypothetical protein
MLMVKVYVNEEKIDEIGLINTGHRNENGDHLYKFRIPADLGQYEIYHKRSDPWYILVSKALEVYRHHNIDVIHGEEAEDATRRSK